MKLVVLDGDTLGDISFSEFYKFGEVVVYHKTASKEETIERIKGATIVLANKVILSEEILRETDELKLIAVLATGYNNIDVNYCKQHNIGVVNVAGYSTQTVTQHTVALLMELNNKTHLFDEYVKEKKYSESGLFTCVGGVYDIHDISGKRWCVVGLGAIGKNVAKVAKALGANVVYFSTTGTHKDDEFESISFEEMVETSDIITIHCPLNDKTKHLFNYSSFKQMKSNVIIINVARGQIVNSSDIALALNQDLIQAYATDVFDVEPIPIDNPLLSVNENKILFSPHVAWASVESRQRLRDETFLNISAFLDGQQRNRIV